MQVRPGPPRFTLKSPRDLWEGRGGRGGWDGGQRCHWKDTTTSSQVCVQAQKDSDLTGQECSSSEKLPGACPPPLQPHTH